MNAEIIDRLQRSFIGGVSQQELLALHRLSTERTLGIVRQFLTFLTAGNRTAEAERDLLLYLVRKQDEMLDALAVPLPPIANEDIDRAGQVKRRE